MSFLLFLIGFVLLVQGAVALSLTFFALAVLCQMYGRKP